MPALPAVKHRAGADQVFWRYLDLSLQGSAQRLGRDGDERRACFRNRVWTKRGREPFSRISTDNCDLVKFNPSIFEESMPPIVSYTPDTMAVARSERHVPQ